MEFFSLFYVFKVKKKCLLHKSEIYKCTMYVEKGAFRDCVNTNGLNERHLYFGFENC